MDFTDIESAITQSANTAFLEDSIGKAYTDLHLYPSSPTESLSGWFQPGNQGNSGGGSSKPHGTSLWTPGQPTTVAVKPAGPYDNFYFLKDLPMIEDFQEDIRSFTSRRQHSVVNLSGVQAIEFEHQLQYNGAIYNMAWQFDVADNMIRYFNYTADPTKSSWIQAPDTAGVKVAPLLANLVTIAEFEVNLSEETVTHVGITINGVSYEVNVTQPATVKPGIGNKLTIAEQLDSTGKPIPISMTVGQCDLFVV